MTTPTALRIVGAAVTASALLLAGGSAHAQLEAETARRSIDLRKVKLPPRTRKPQAVDSFRGRYRYRVACHRRLLPIRDHLRRCIDVQRMSSGEFHTRLDLAIEPSGALKKFSIRGSRDQLEACLTPHVLPIKFPPYTGRKRFVLHVLVGSEGVRLGRRTRARPVKAYPVDSPEQRRRYARAASWVTSPWRYAATTCAEWVDRVLGFGYEVRAAAAVSPAGRPLTAEVELTGPMADKALDKYLGCALPFLKGMRAPRHEGAAPFPVRFGTRTARWSPD